MPEPVRITDVSPRDGLQNEPGVIPSDQKARLIDLLCDTGVDEVEITSFVSPKWVPQLGDAAAVCLEVARLRALKPTPLLSALVPNLKGFELHTSLKHETTRAAYDAGNDETPGPLIQKISLFTAASETFSKRNTNATIAETLARFREIMNVRDPDDAVRAYISCVIACPFEGPIAPAKVADIAAALIDLGVTEIDLGDTIGAATPETTERLLDAVRDRIGSGWFNRRALTLHLHDTFGRAADCVKAALNLGVRSFDGSVAGLGGCPYASTPGKRAPGNIDTRLLVETIHRAGFTTTVDLDALDRAASYAREIVAQSRLTPEANP